MKVLRDRETGTSRGAGRRPRRKKEAKKTTLKKFRRRIPLYLSLTAMGSVLAGLIFTGALSVQGASLTDAIKDRFAFSGYLQSTYRQSVHKENPLAAIQRVGLETRFNQGSWIRGFASGYVDTDLSVTGRWHSREPVVTPEVGEAYLTIDTHYADLIVGMQQIRWGEAGALSTFDLINPIDYRNPIATGRSTQRLSVGAADLRVSLKGLGLLDLICVPFPRFSRLAEYGSPWEDKGLRELRHYVGEGLVGRKYDNGPFEPEFAGRLKFFQSGYDLAFMFFKGYEHKPLYTAGIDYQNMSATIHETYKTFEAFGLSSAVSILKSTLRTEFTLRHNYPFQSDDIDIERRNDYEAFIGWDRMFLTNLNVNLQTFFSSYDGKKVRGKDRERYGATWSVSDKYLDDALTAGVRGEYFANNDDACVEVFGEYEYDDHLRFTAGYMFFSGGKSNDLGQYDKNDHFYFGVKYSF